MKSRCFLVFALLSAAFAQRTPPPPTAAPPDLPDETVIAEFEDGVQFTMADFKRVFATLAPAQQQNALRDRKLFLHEYAFMRKLTRLAEEAKLQEQSPYKESLEQHRMVILSQAKIQDALNHAVVEPEEIVKAYETDQKKYTQVKVKALYIAFGDPASTTAAKKPLTEAAALAKAGKLLSAARSGADFVKLVRENSD